MGSPQSADLEIPITLPLSLSQREVWLDQRAWPGSVHLNIGGAGFLVGRLDPMRLQEALHILVRRYDALRLAPLADGRQILLTTFEPDLDLIDIHTSVPDPRQAMRNWWQTRIREPFVLDGRKPPWRFALLRAGPDLHGLAIQFHHLVMDGWGTTQVMRAWSQIYQELEDTIDGAPLSVSELDAPSYLDFIQESLAYRDSDQFRRDAEYWYRQLGTLESPLLQSRYSVTRSKQLPSAYLAKMALTRADYTRLGSMARQLGSNLFASFMAALALYYCKLQGRRSVLIGVPSFNRTGRHFRHTPGMFAGILVVHLHWETSATVADFLHHIGQQLQTALRHSRYPLSELSQQLHMLREGRDSLFDVLLSFERQDYQLSFGAAHSQEARQQFCGLARYPLAVSICEFDTHADPELVLEASSACFDPGEAELLGNRIWHLAQTLVQQPATRLEQIDILPAKERWALLDGLHKDLAQMEAPQPYIDLFEHQAALWPERCALVWNEGQMNYGELARRVEALAGQLRAYGAARNKVVALAIERSPEMVLAILAISRAAAAFLPINPHAPLARLASIMADSGAVALLVDSAVPASLFSLHSCCLSVTGERLMATEQAGPASIPPPTLWTWARAGPNDLAYVLFTSGSSGRPKGVMIEHAALSRRLAWLSKTWAISADDCSAQGTQLSFDPSLIELLLPLTQGASIALPPPGRQHPQRLAEFILHHGVTFSAFVPSVLPGLLAGWRGKKGLKLRVACCGGEKLSPTLAMRFVRETGAKLYNLYGPTETTIFATAWPCGADPSDMEVDDLETETDSENSPDLPIGYPIDDTRIYVLGPQLQVQPFGVTGDIFIGGGALARGYLGCSEPEQEAFLSDPFEPGQRIYRSGDRGWFDVLGRLHFSGRADRQIKLRGYRIELGDIEAACLSLPEVNQAAVQLINRPGQSPALHAWLAGIQLEPLVLQARLRALLPDYMWPSDITCLAELPLTAHGKNDLSALPQPARHTSKVLPAIKCHTTNEMERKLHTLWVQMLGLPADPVTVASEALASNIGIHDNFFDLGGDSLAALSILTAMEEYLGRTDLHLHLFREYPTIAELALALGAPQAKLGVLQPLSKGIQCSYDCKPVIYLAASGFGDVLRLQNLARSLQGDAQVFMLQAPLESTPATMKEFAALYADSIEAQGRQPCWLAGFSVGGITALETALELHRRGLRQLGLMLLDTIHPDAVFGGAAFWRVLGWLVCKLHMQELSMNGRRLSAMFSDPGLISQVMALRGHHCQAFDGPVLLVKSSGLAGWNRLLFQAWHRMMPRQLNTRLVSGLHGSIFEPSHVDELAAVLLQFIQISQEQSSV